MMDGFGKAVDAVNNAADKAGKYAKEKELDKKIDHAAEVVTKEAKKERNQECIFKREKIEEEDCKLCGLQMDGTIMKC